MYKILLLLISINLNNFSSAQNISFEEKKADSLHKYHDFYNAKVNYEIALKKNAKTAFDSVRIILKNTNNNYYNDDTENYKQDLEKLNFLRKNNPIINNNSHLSSYIDFVNGKYHLQCLNYDSANKFMNDAIRKRILHYKDTLLADYFTNLGIISANKYSHNKSIIFYNLAIKYYFKNNIYNYNIINILLLKAYSYWLQNNLAKFKKINEVCLKHITNLNIDYSYIAQIYFNLGTYYLHKYDYFNAYKYFTRIKLDKLVENKKFQGYYYLAITYYYLGDFVLAKDYFQKIKKNNNSFIKSKQKEINFYYSFTHLKSNNYDSSIIYLNKSLLYENLNTNIKQEYIYFSLAHSYDKWNKTDSALKYISLALSKFENKSDPEYPKCLFLKGKILNNYLSDNLYSDAQYYILRNCGIKSPKTAYLFSEISKTKFENKLYNEALIYAQKALISVDKEFNSQDVFDNPKCNQIFSTVYLANILKYKSEALELIYKQNDSIQFLVASYETSKLLTEQIEKMLTSYPLFESKQFLIDNTEKLFSRAQHLGYLCWKKTKNQKYKEENIVLSEKSRASILNSQIQESEFLNKNINDSINSKLQEFEQNIAYLTNQINENSNDFDNSILSDLKTSLFELEIQKNKLTESKKGDFGNYSNYFKNEQSMSYSDIINYPSRNDAILEYSICDSLIILNVINKNHHEIFEIPFNDTLKQKMNQFKKMIAPKNIWDITLTSKDSIINIGKYLYDALLKPSEKMIKNKQLLIVQDPKLGFIPFEALYFDNKFLIEYYPINYLYSININHLLKNKKTNTTDYKMLAFLPSYEINLNNTTKNTKAIYKSLPPLDYKTESESIYNITGCDTVLANNATESNFKKLAGNYNILHLALHSILNPENYNFSKLCFTAVNDTLNDGLFNLCDVAPLKLNSNLTFLSGCNTGDGQIIKGEGVMSFARSFILAGSNSIVMSLWELNSSTSIDINTGFYKYLSDGYNKAEALQLSKIDYINKQDNLHKHPFFWSSLVLIGNNENINIIKHHSNKSKVILIAGIILISILVILIFKYRKNIAEKIFNDDNIDNNNEDCGC